MMGLGYYYHVVFHVHKANYRVRLLLYNRRSCFSMNTYSVLGYLEAAVTRPCFIVIGAASCYSSYSLVMKPPNPHLDEQGELLSCCSSLFCHPSLFEPTAEGYVGGRFYKLVPMEGRVSILLGCLHVSRTVSFCFSFSHVARYAPSWKTKPTAR